MTLTRQQAFQQLRSPCVELSAVALKFRGNQASIKAVSQALDNLLAILQQLGRANALDEKLSDTPALLKMSGDSDESIDILVKQGWRQRLTPEMGRQLLILMTLVAGTAEQSRHEPPSEELKVAAFHCIGALVKELTRRPDGVDIFNDVGSKNIVDQLAYLLLESVIDEASEQVQLAAADSLLTLYGSISNRVLLASLLPRTASALTQSLRPSTKARRTRKVLISYLRLLTYILRALLADEAVHPLADPNTAHANENSAPTIVLDESWLKATSTQVNLVLVQVFKLRNHEHLSVREAIADLCFMIVMDCSKTLAETQGLAIETIVFVAQYVEGDKQIARLENASISAPDISNILMTKHHDWIQSLPRVMQVNDEQVKQTLLGQINVSLIIAADISRVSGDVLANLTDKLLESVAVSDTRTTGLHSTPSRNGQLAIQAHELDENHSQKTFAPLVLQRSSQVSSLQQMDQLIRSLHSLGYAHQIARLALERLPNLSYSEQVIGIWLAMQCLGQRDEEGSVLELIGSSGDDWHISRPHLVSDLYAFTLPFLLDDTALDSGSNGRLTALAIECTVLQAQQLGLTYRTELLDTLYPVLSLLGSNDSMLRGHALVGLNLLAKACSYASTGDMLIDNVDYLINTVGMKLNSFDVSPQAPQVLLMMLRLCGARIIPYIDDLIGSIFSGLDNFHGYPRLVELLFQVLRTVVRESSRQALLVTGHESNTPGHVQEVESPSKVNNIISDLQRRSARKRKHQYLDDDVEGMPHRPRRTFDSEMESIATRTSHKDAENDQILSQGPTSNQDSTDRTLSKSHQLLLNIAQSTIPHLTSPSPQVRSILLELLNEVSPLLAQDENSFLPLINAVWPAVIPRLLASKEDDLNTETPYNVCAAAGTIATLCEGAGSFMSSRIDEIFPRLRKLFHLVRRKEDSKDITQSAADDDQVILFKAQDKHAVPNLRSSRTQILAALIRLLTAILSNVRVTADTGDEILALLAPFSDDTGHEAVRRALINYNADAFWLWKRIHGNTNEKINEFLEGAD